MEEEIFAHRAGYKSWMSWTLATWVGGGWCSEGGENRHWLVYYMQWFQLLCGWCCRVSYEAASSWDDGDRAKPALLTTDLRSATSSVNSRPSHWRWQPASPLFLSLLSLSLSLSLCLSLPSFFISFSLRSRFLPLLSFLSPHFLPSKSKRILENP